MEYNPAEFIAVRIKDLKLMLELWDNIAQTYDDDTEGYELYHRLHDEVYGR